MYWPAHDTVFRRVVGTHIAARTPAYPLSPDRRGQGSGCAQAHERSSKVVERLGDDNPLAYLHVILASPVACVAPSTKERPDRSTRTQSSFKAKRTFSCGVRRSKQAVSLVSEQRVSQAWHRKRQRLPRAVIEVEMALTLLRFLRLGRRIFQTETLPREQAASY